MAEATARRARIAACVDFRLIISNGPRRGFTKTANDGMRQTTSEDVCLLNDDVVWYQFGWLRTLHRALHSSREIGIVGPSGGSSTAPMRDAKPGLSGLEVVGHLPFWCVLIKRAVIDKMGLLDEDFIHYASDNLYCDQLPRYGWVSVWCRDVYLHHQHHGSGLIQEWREHDQEVYARKAGQRARRGNI